MNTRGRPTSWAGFNMPAEKAITSLNRSPFKSPMVRA
jgi:hypothetical protein